MPFKIFVFVCKPSELVVNMTYKAGENGEASDQLIASNWGTTR